MQFIESLGAIGGCRCDGNQRFHLAIPQAVADWWHSVALQPGAVCGRDLKVSNADIFVNDKYQKKEATPLSAESPGCLRVKDSVGMD